jgi:hypothetical protein
MKIVRSSAALLIAIVLPVTALMAEPLNSMSLSGATGLYTVPTGRVGWRDTAKTGLDIGYHTIISRDDHHSDRGGYELNHIPKIGAGFFNWAELFLAVDVQPAYDFPGSNNDSNTDLITGFKAQLPVKVTDIALGGNFQALNMGNSDYNYQTLQIYAAMTYGGTFFTLPVETTVALGKTFAFNTDDNDSLQDFDFDFGMGFDVTLFPNALPGFFHWITDYSNFSYSADPWGVNVSYRGALNTGIRFNFGSIPAMGTYKLALDVVLTDAFDEYFRSFAFGLVVGIPLK